MSGRESKHGASCLRELAVPGSVSERRLAPVLFQDEVPAAARGRRCAPVAKAQVSGEAPRKAFDLLGVESRRTGSHNRDRIRVVCDRERSKARNKLRNETRLEPPLKFRLNSGQDSIPEWGRSPASIGVSEAPCDIG